jgi:hypothetical protein
MGRPSEFTQEIADAICERLADAQSLRSICLDDAMPSQATVFRWLADDRYVSFREQYTRARDAQADAIFDEILDIADDGSNDWMEREREDGSKFEVLNAEHVQRSRLRIDARKWMAGKLAPKKYGEKTLLGSDPDNPLPSGITVTFVKPDDVAVED